MRCVCITSLALLFAASASVRAEEQGSIGVQVKIDEGKIVIVKPLEGGPADKAGLKADDIIMKIDDHKVKDNAEREDLQAAVEVIAKRKPGDKVKITVKRGEKEMTIEVTVGKRSEVLKGLDKDKN